MKFLFRQIVLSSLLMISIAVFGQNSQLKKADAFYARGEYYEALKLYNEVKNAGHKLDIPTQIKMGRCYYNLNNIETAYGIFEELEDYLRGEDLFIYASTAHKIGFYSGAVELYKKVRPQMAGRQSQIDEMIKACEWADKNMTFVPGVTVNPSSLFISGQSFGIQYYDKGVVYSSAIEDPKAKSKKTKTDKQGMTFLNLFYSDLSDGQVSSKKRLFSNNLKFDFHVGAISFTSDMKTMYYTKTVRVKGGNSRLKIYKVTHNGRDWVNEKEVEFNSNEYDNAHPAVSPDDKYLYFVSNRPGGYGGKDLYVVERKPNGTYGTPRNLGPNVNTFGDEMFPYISKDNVLYFSSDGHIGFGGLDIFRAENVNGEWKNVKNMMQPFNSEKDDFGYVIDPTNPLYGFLSSNRTGTGVNDVIFYVLYNEELMKKNEEKTMTSTETKSELPANFITKILSTFNNEPVVGATIVIKDSFTESVVVQGVSGNAGIVSLVIPENFKSKSQEFEIIVSKSNEYQTKRLIVNITEFEDFAQSGIILTPIFNEKDLNDIGEIIIPYRGNEITPAGFSELDRLVVFMKRNPHVVVKLNGHTEARGDQTANLNTSQAMAEKAKQYLLSKGIPSENVIPRGYAERYIKNKCKRGIYCSDSEHLVNRRIEVVVWRFLK